MDRQFRIPGRRGAGRYSRNGPLARLILTPIWWILTIHVVCGHDARGMSGRRPGCCTAGILGVPRWDRLATIGFVPADRHAKTGTRVALPSR